MEPFGAPATPADSRVFEGPVSTPAAPLRHPRPTELRQGPRARTATALPSRRPTEGDGLLQILGIVEVCGSWPGVVSAATGESVGLASPVRVGSCRPSASHRGRGPNTRHAGSAPRAPRPAGRSEGEPADSRPVTVCPLPPLATQALRPGSPPGPVDPRRCHVFGRVGTFYRRPRRALAVGRYWLSYLSPWQVRQASVRRGALRNRSLHFRSHPGHPNHCRGLAGAAAGASRGTV